MTESSCPVFASAEEELVVPAAIGSTSLCVQVPWRVYAWTYHNGHFLSLQTSDLSMDTTATDAHQC